MEDWTKGIEETFLTVPEDCFAIYQVKNGPDYRLLRFADMRSIISGSNRFRSQVCWEKEKIERIMFDSREAVVNRLRDDGFTVVPSVDPGRVTVRSGLMTEAAFNILYGNGFCRVDSCDTRSLDSPVRHGSYEAVYVERMPEERKIRTEAETREYLDELFVRFNLSGQESFGGHSLSVSDVIALKRDGQPSFHYIDSSGYVPLQGFLESPVRSAELSDGFGTVRVADSGKRLSILKLLRETKPEAHTLKHPVRVKARLRAYPEI